MHLTVQGRSVAPVELAVTAGARRRGLLGRDGLEGALWLQPCKQVHTVRMRFAIDIAHLAADGTVLAVATLPPHRFGRVVLRARAVVEAEAGSFAAWGLVVGAVVGTTGTAA